MTKRELLKALEGMQELLRWQTHMIRATIHSLEQDIRKSQKQATSQRGKKADSENPQE